MKIAVILSIIVTAGIIFPIAFICGAILTRPARDELEKQKQAYEIQLSNLQESDNEIIQSHIKVIAQLQDERKTLKADNLEWTEKAIVLQREVQSLTTQPENLTENNIPGGFVVKNISAAESENYNTIIGEIVNKSNHEYQMCNFTCSIYGPGGVLLDSAPILIAEFYKNQTRTFSTTSFESKGLQISRIDVAFNSGL